MISYEVGMGLALVAVIMYSGSLRMSEIVASQDTVWNVVPQLPAFVIYLIAGLAETNRPPFDLAEAETELVAGFHTEYSGIKFAMFYLGEYLNTVTVAAVATTLWLGGWRGPAPEFLPWLWPLLWFLVKVLLIVYVYIWIRATLPRFRYDRLMAFGWKFLIPFGLVWVLATGAVVVLPDVYGRREVVIGAAIVVGAVLVLSLIWPLFSRPARPAEEEEVGRPVSEEPRAGERWHRRHRARDGHRLQADLPSRRHRAVPEADRHAAREEPHRAAPAQHARERAGEVHRVRAVRLRVPGRRDLGRGCRQRPRAARQSGRAVREGLPDQLPALHHVRLLRRGVPDARADPDERVRDGFTSREDAIFTKEQLLSRRCRLGTAPGTKEGR